MSKQQNPYPINSLQYWDKRFRTDSWNSNHGQQQTSFFMNLLISFLPIDVHKDIYNNHYSLLDWGCALGNGCYEVSKAFPSSNITGLDFSEQAIIQCRQLYPELKFRTTSLSPIEDKFDVIFCSNVLEHLNDTQSYLKLFTEVAQKYIIILVPYQNEIFDEHVVSFNDNSFPEEINGFKAVQSKIINTNYSGFWNGFQMLKVYKKV